MSFASHDKANERTVSLKRAEFSDEERAFYSALEVESRQQFKGMFDFVVQRCQAIVSLATLKNYADAGTVQSNYVNILWMLLRLRQACNHPHLVKGHKTDGANDATKKLPAEKRMHLLSLLEANRDICSICSDIPDEPTICICTHIFCRQCILERLATGDDNGCPAPKCKMSLNASLVYTSASLSNHEQGSGSKDGKSPSPQVKEECHIRENVPWKSSSKIDAVIDTLAALPPVQLVVVNGKVVEQIGEDKASTEKAIVFSQWTSMLDLLEVKLKEAKFNYRRLDGTMTVLAKDRAALEFKTLSEVCKRSQRV